MPCSPEFWDTGPATPVSAPPSTATLGNYDLEQDVRPMVGPLLGFLGRQ